MAVNVLTFKADTKDNNATYTCKASSVVEPMHIKKTETRLAVNCKFYHSENRYIYVKFSNASYNINETCNHQHPFPPTHVVSAILRSDSPADNHFLAHQTRAHDYTLLENKIIELEERIQNKN